MSRRKIFEKQVVDVQTGELLSTTSEYVSENTERFFMGRTTEGIEWLLNFNNLTEVQLFLMMIELENPKNKYIIPFSKLQVEESSQILKMSEAMVRKCLTNLVKNNFLARVCSGNYIANPLTFYQGGTKTLKEKVKNFAKYSVK